MTDALASGKLAGAGTAADMAGMMMGMNLAEEMMKKMKETDTEKTEPETKKEDAMQGGAGKRPNFCQTAGTKVSGRKFLFELRI